MTDVLDDRDQWQSTGCRVVLPDDIGARTAKRAATSIYAEIISLRAGVKATPPRDGDGPIHGFPS